jgi:hypothetical protein
MSHTLGKRIVIALAIAGSVFGAPLIWAYGAGASPNHSASASLKAAEQRATQSIARQTSIERAESASSPNPVSLLSPVVGVMQTGAAVGPAIVSGVAVTGVSSIPVPGAVSSQIDNAIVAASGAMAKYGPLELAQVQQAIAPLACLNAAINSGITEFANATDDATNALASVIDPLNVTLQQVATLAQSFEEPAVSC